jgi:transcriptional regulator with XRE-family HTH domain
MDMRKIVGENFASLRKAKGLTQHQAAEASGFSQAYIGWLERGRRNPTVISLWLLAQAVDATPADLVRAQDSST